MSALRDVARSPGDCLVAGLPGMYEGRDPVSPGICVFLQKLARKPRQEGDHLSTHGRSPIPRSGCGDMLRPMAARNRPPPRAAILGVTDALREHMALTREHKALMREVAELRDAGKVGEARRLMKKTEAVYGELRSNRRYGQSGRVNESVRYAATLCS
jgi:hypothetical protein